MTGAIQQADFAILRWIQDTLRCGALDFLLPKITLLGDAGAVWLAAALGMLLVKKYRRCGLTIAAGLALCFLLGNLILKPLVARPRPCWLDAGVQLLIPMETDYSFPSGHTLASFAAATILSKRDRRFGYAAFPLAGLIGFSRLYLYVHFPSDVLFGAALGAAIGLFAAWAAGRVFSRGFSSGGKQTPPGV